MVGKKLKSVAHELNLYLKADHIVAVYPDIKAKNNRVNLFEYHPDRFGYYLHNGVGYNLGDALGVIIVEWMLAKRGLKIDQEVKGRKHLNCVGSNVFSSYQNTTVWGSGAGAMSELSNRTTKVLNSYPFRRLDVRAVRGPMTRDLLLKYGQKCPEVYGDPAILMPLIYQPETKKEFNEFLIIPQFIGEKEIREKYPDYPMESMNTNEYKRVVDAIVHSKKVITSSLHGIILAEAYGVPTVFFKTLKREFKFKDYYASTGRFDIRIAESIEEAFKMEPLPLPDLSALQQGLLDSFPYDLWEK